MFNSLLSTIKIGINASKLTVIIPLVFFVIIFIGSKFSKKNEWNDDYLSKTQTKIIKGFCAIGIILHHLAQKTAASWLNSQYIIHGLDFFVNIGYLFVGTFLFISGYGLYKSYKANENYFNNYFSRRILPIILAYLTTSLIYYFYDPTPSTYNWYIAAILICYVLFYFGFKCFKNEIISFLIVIVGIVVYSAFCSFMMLGGWWYNTIGLFIIGLIYAKYENRVVPFLKKTYLPLLVLSIVLAFVCNWYGRHYENVVYSVTKESVYDLYTLYIILFRFVAAINFTLAVILTSLKCKFNNRVLSFYGSISLEFYLIQGLFVQMFSYCYFDIMIKPLYYIENIPLYIVVTVVLSTLAGFTINYIDKKIAEFLVYFSKKRKQEINFVLKALKNLFLVILVILVIYLLLLSGKSFIDNKGSKQAIENYVDKYISFADVGDKKMAAYIVGEGKDTLVFMRGNNDPCPSLSMRYLADKLSEDYKVVVLDYFGTGFSDKPTTERTTQNIVYEIHEALQDFGIDSDYILVPQYISGIYAQEYAKRYSNEIKGIIAIECETYPERKVVLNYLNVSPVEYHKHIQIENTFYYLLGKLRYIKGVDTLLWPVFLDFYRLGLEEDELIVARNIFFKNIYNSTFLNENKNELDNITNFHTTQYPRNIYVYDILGHYDRLVISSMGYKAEDLHAQVCFEQAKHKTKEVNDLYNCFFFAPGIIKNLVDDAVVFMK